MIRKINYASKHLFQSANIIVTIHITLQSSSLSETVKKEVAAFLVVDKAIICEAPIPTILISAFYTFNIQYPARTLTHS